MQVGIDYNFRDDLFNDKEDGSTCPIELLLDPYAGVVYRYTTVRFKLGEDDIPRLQYDYEIVKTNDLSMVTLRKNQKFNDILGLILNSLLLDLGDVEANETRNNNLEESDSEGGLHTESPSVSET
jgi:hypothetical protein